MQTMPLATIPPGGTHYNIANHFTYIRTTIYRYLFVDVIVL